LNNEEISHSGDVDEIINTYQKQNISAVQNHLRFADNKDFNNEHIKLLELKIFSPKGDSIDVESGFKIKIKFLNKKANINLALSFTIFSKDDVLLMEAPTYISRNFDSEISIYEIEQEFPGYLLNSDFYNLGVLFGENQQIVLMNINNILTFEIKDTLFNRGINYNKFPGIIRPQFKSTINKIHE